MTAVAHTGAGRWRVAPDGLAAGVLLAIFTTAGLLYVDMLAALVAGLQDGLGFTARQAGLIASANIYGAAAGGLLAAFIVRHLRWRSTAVILLLALIGIDLGSTLVFDPWALLALRAVHGLVGGTLVGVGYSRIARTRSPERSFAMLLFVQFGVGGLGVMVLPPLVPTHGAAVLFLALATFSLLTLGLMPFMPEHPPRRALGQPTGGRGGGSQARLGLVCALAAVFLFQAGSMGLTAYVFGLARALGHPLGLVSLVSGASHWIALGGSLLVMGLGLRFGRLAPILAGIAIGVLSRAAFHWAQPDAVFMAAAAVTAVTHAFILPYLLGLCAAYDDGGRVAAVAGFFSKLGLASGPALAALLVAGGHFDRVIVMSVCGLGVAALAAAYPALDNDRRAAIR